MTSGAEAQESLELSFVYDEEEYLAAWRAFRASRPHAKFDRALRVGFTASLLVLLWLVGDVRVAGMGVAFVLFMLALNYYVERVQPLRELRRERNFRDPYRVTFAERGVRIVSKGYDAWLEWGFYKKALETADFFFLVYDDERYLLVPKRALRDRGQERALRGMLRRKLGHRVEAHGLPSADADEAVREYVPPAEPPDWR